MRAALRVAAYDTARRHADALLAQAPDDSGARALAGDALWSAGLFDEAEAAYSHAIAIDAGSARARFGIARSLFSRSRLPEALSETLSALATAPDDGDLHALAGAIYERLYRFEEAAAAYSRYAALVPAAETTPAATARARAAFLRSFGSRMPLALDGKGAAAAHTVPFKLVRNKVVVQGRLNAVPVEWVVDTGAERTGVSYALAAAARVRPVTATLGAGVGRASLRQVQLGRADRVDVGTLHIRNVPISIRNPARGGAARWQSESLSPHALGLSVVIDYPRRQLTLARTLEAAEGDVVLPLRLQRLPLVRGLVNSRHPAPFVVDTGGEVISLSADLASALAMPPMRHIPLRVFGMSGVDEDAFLLPGVDLDFEALEFRKVGLAVLNLRAPSVLLGFQVGGIVGHKLLGQYRVAIDLVRSEVRLRKGGWAGGAGGANEAGSSLPAPLAP